MTYSFCHADDKLDYPRNDYRFLPSCVRKKNRARQNTIVSYPSTRSGLNRLEQELDRLDKLEQELDQELKREQIRLNEPLKGFARLKQKFAKKTPVLVEQKLHVVQVHEPFETLSEIKPNKKVSKLVSFFSKKKSTIDKQQFDPEMSLQILSEPTEIPVALPPFGQDKKVSKLVLFFQKKKHFCSPCN